MQILARSMVSPGAQASHYFLDTRQEALVLQDCTIVEEPADLGNTKVVVRNAAGGFRTSQMHVWILRVQCLHFFYTSSISNTCIFFSTLIYLDIEESVFATQ